MHDQESKTWLRHAVELLEHGQTQKEVASEVGFMGLEAASALCHFFKKHTGLSPAKYLDQVHGSQLSKKPADAKATPLRLNLWPASPRADI